jgi:amino acid efflux transporter
MENSASPAETLSTARGAALYVGALLGPSLLLLPGLAAALAGPASIIAWIGLLGLSGLLATVFSALGTRISAVGGPVGYATAAFGPRAGRAVGWCFLGGVILGAPVVCLVGGRYVAVLLGGGRAVGIGAAVALLLLVLVLTMSGARAGGSVQLGLIGLLVALVVIAVLGSAPAERLSNWTPFAPHGITSIGSAASTLMLSFVGWESIAPLTRTLRDPGRQLPRVIGIAFTVTALIYLALAVATIGVLGPRAGGDTPLSALLRVAIGTAGPAIAAVCAVVVTLAATNAYLAGAAELAAALRGTAGRGRGLQLGIGVVGLLVLGSVALRWTDTAALVTIPTTLFLLVYLGCTAAAARILTGGVRVAAVLSCVAVGGVLLFAGWTLLAGAVLIAVAVIRRSASGSVREPLLHEDQLVGGVAVPVVERGRGGVVRLDQQVDLPAALAHQAPLQFGQDRAALPGTALIRAGGQPVDPAAPPVERAEHRGGQALLVLGDQHQLRVARQHRGQLGGHVLGPEGEPGVPPQLHQRGPVRAGGLANPHTPQDKPAQSPTVPSASSRNTSR